MWAKDICRIRGASRVGKNHVDRTSPEAIWIGGGDQMGSDCRTRLAVRASCTDCRSISSALGTNHAALRNPCESPGIPGSEMAKALLHVDASTVIRGW